MMTIALTQNKVAVVDDDDYERLSKFSWRFGSNGYAYRGVWDSTIQNNRQIAMHREVLKLNSGGQVDHTNRDRLDNRKENLRPADQTLQEFNKPKRARKSSSKYKGVMWCNTHETWIAKMQLRGKVVLCKYFKSEVEAAKAYDAAVRQHIGSIGHTNFGSSFE